MVQGGKKKAKRRLTDKEKESIGNLLRQYPNFPLKRLAMLFGVNKPSVKRALKDMGKDYNKLSGLIESPDSGGRIESATFEKEKEGIPTIGG